MEFTDSTSVPEQCKFCKGKKKIYGFTDFEAQCLAKSNVEHRICGQCTDGQIEKRYFNFNRSCPDCNRIDARLTDIFGNEKCDFKLILPKPRINLSPVYKDPNIFKAYLERCDTVTSYLERAGTPTDKMLAMYDCVKEHSDRIHRGLLDDKILVPCQDEILTQREVHDMIPEKFKDDIEVRALINKRAFHCGAYEKPTITLKSVACPLCSIKEFECLCVVPRETTIEVNVGFMPFCGGKPKGVVTATSLPICTPPYEAVLDRYLDLAKKSAKPEHELDKSITRRMVNRFYGIFGVTSFDRVSKKEFYQQLSPEHKKFIGDQFIKGSVIGLGCIPIKLVENALVTSPDVAVDNFLKSGLAINKPSWADKMKVSGIKFQYSTLSPPTKSDAYPTVLKSTTMEMMPPNLQSIVEEKTKNVFPKATAHDLWCIAINDNLTRDLIGKKLYSAETYNFIRPNQTFSEYIQKINGVPSGDYHNIKLSLLQKGGRLPKWCLHVLRYNGLFKTDKKEKPGKLSLVAKIKMITDGLITEQNHLSLIYKSANSGKKRNFNTQKGQNKGPDYNRNYTAPVQGETGVQNLDEYAGDSGWYYKEPSWNSQPTRGTSRGRGSYRGRGRGSKTRGTSSN